MRRKSRLRLNRLPQPEIGCTLLKLDRASALGSASYGTNKPNPHR